LTADLGALLEKTSRTFALSIPALPEPTRREVTVAYLLFRIADTFEDASHWSKEKRLSALDAFRALLVDPSSAEAARLAGRWVEDGASAHEGYVRLLSETAAVLEAYTSLRPEAQALLGSHVGRSADGMASFVSRTRDDGTLELDDLSDLRGYCYAVAGIVGEMLTELFLLGRPRLAPAAGELRARAARFGEALQLVNILKDSEDDRAEGRRYLPSGVPRGDVFALARADLEAAGEYIGGLQRAGAPRGIVEFTALPVALAWAALERVESAGPGSKVSRPQLFQISQRVKSALDRDELPVPERSETAEGRQA
jgi:farnesyl-diphosphate farnesyltransferase